MPFCSACGAEVGADVSSCPKCGKPVATPGAAAGTGLEENLAGLLCYLVGWITGLVFFLIDKRPFVRFHAMQSIITFGALTILQWLLVWSGWFVGLAWFLSKLVGLVTLALWILLMVKAFQKERFKLPVVGDLAENYSK